MKHCIEIIKWLTFSGLFQLLRKNVHLFWLNTLVFVVDGIDRFTTVRMPWHDIACVVFNKAATDVGRHFIQRWNHAKKVKASSKSSSKYPLLRPRSTKTTYKRLPSFIKEFCELVNVQVRLSCGTYSAQIHEHFIIIDIWLLTVY